MQETSSLYKRLLADPGHWKECRLVIDEKGKLITELNESILFGSTAYNRSAKGSVIQLEETTNTPLKGLALYGKTTQNGKPSPENPVPLESVGDITVSVTNGNLLGFPYSYNSQTINGIDFTVNPDGSITLNGTATKEAMFYLTGQNSNQLYLPVGTYFFSGIPSGNFGGNLRPQYYVTNGMGVPAFSVYSEGKKVAITVPGIYRVIIDIVAGNTFDNVTFYPMVTAGESPLPYEQPEAAQTLLLSNPNGLPGIPVSSGGNYTDENGQQWICDEMDFTNGVYIQRVKSVVLTGTSGGVEISSGYRRYYYNVKSDYNKDYRYNVWSSHFASTVNPGYGTCYITSDGYISLFLSESMQDYDSSTFKTWLSANPVTVQYILAEEKATPLSEEQLVDFSVLHTNYQNTTIFNDAGSGMEVTYTMNGEGPVRILIGTSGADAGYAEDIIVSMQTYCSMFPEETPVVGECIAGEISATIRKPKGDIPRMSRVAPYVRVCNSEKQSEWIRKGVYFIDKRSYSGEDNELMEIHGFDSMLMCEADFPSSNAAWPRKDIDVVRDIANEMDVTVDSRTVAIMNKGYMVQYPAEYSQREVLGFLAAMYAGSFVISDTGELRLIQLNGIPKETSFLTDHAGFVLLLGGDRILV